MGLIARVCVKCGKTKGNLSFRYQEDGKWRRGYFHPKCFNAFIKKISKEVSRG